MQDLSYRRGEHWGTLLYNGEPLIEGGTSQIIMNIVETLIEKSLHNFQMKHACIFSECTGKRFVQLM